MVTSRRSLDAALVHDDLTTHEDTIFCLNFDRDGMPTRTHTSRNPFVRRSTVECTPTQPHSSLASHNLQHGRTRSRSGTRATSTAHPLTQHCDVRARLAHKQMRLRLGAHRAAGSQHPFCQHRCQHVATALPPATPAIPRPTILHPAVLLLGPRPRPLTLSPYPPMFPP
jgi:hypothetical protein